MNLHFYRINHKTGQTYEFESIEKDTKTTISIPKTGKSITVNFNLGDLAQSYYHWQNSGQHIQDAFPYLSADEREFLLTGITCQEWLELFNEED